MIEVSCRDMKMKGHSKGDGMYWLHPDGESHSNAFLAYCDMTSYNGGWTMCYTTHEYAKPRTEVKYNFTFPYGTDGYRTNCNNIKVSWLIHGFEWLIELAMDKLARVLETVLTITVIISPVETSNSKNPITKCISENIIASFSPYFAVAFCSSSQKSCLLITKLEWKPTSHDVARHQLKPLTLATDITTAVSMECGTECCRTD